MSDRRIPGGPRRQPHEKFRRGAQGWVGLDLAAPQPQDPPEGIGSSADIRPHSPAFQISEIDSN
jgi:hypothetical protein